MTDFHIIGGGVIGMMTAKELVDAGATVTILDRKSFAQESSWAGGGILSPLHPWRYPKPVNELTYRSQAVYPSYCRFLLAQTGIDPEWIQSGLLIHDAAQELSAVKQWLTEYPTRHELLVGSDIRVYEPNLSAHSSHAILLPEVAQVRNPRLTQALKHYLMLKGVEIKENCEVLRIACSQSRVKHIDTVSGKMAVRQLIVASGAWSAKILATAGTRIPIRPVKGQMLLYYDEKQRVKNITLAEDHYVIPRRDGHILVGSTTEYTQFNKSTTANGLKELKSFAEKWFPFTRELAVVQHWAGLRPGTVDGVPYIGQVPGIIGLFINAGHFRNGVVTGPASAQLLADILLKRASSLPAEKFALEIDTPVSL